MNPKFSVMKTNGNRIINQMTTLLFIILPLMTGTISCQKDPQIDLDITKFQWELESITYDNDKDKKPNGEFNRGNAYILWFSSDTTFALNTSANYAGGKYQIVSKGKINIIDYFAYTMACCETKFDDKMITTFNKMTSYTQEGDHLIFSGNIEGRKAIVKFLNIRNKGH